MAERIKQDPHRGSDTSDVPQMLRAYDQPWGKTLTRGVGAAPKACHAEGFQRPLSPAPALPDFARRVPTSMLAELSSNWPADAAGWDYWKQPIEEFVSIVQFRNDMVKEI